MKKVFLVIIAASLFYGCKKNELVNPPTQNISLTDSDKINDLLILKDGIKISEALTLNNTNSSNNAIELDDTFPGGKVDLSVSYTNNDTLTKFKLSITGASNYWLANIDSTSFSDSIKIAHISFKMPNNLEAGTLLFDYMLFKSETIKTSLIRAKVKVLQFISSGGTIFI